jgi:acyl dehydratase
MPDKYKVGDFHEIKRAFSYDDVKLFSQLSTDFNPIHLDYEFSKSTVFGKPIVHGLLASSLFSSIIANTLPGPGSIYLNQTLSFKSPIFHDLPIIAKVEIISIREDKPIYELKTICINEQGDILIEGVAIVLNKNL